MDKRTNNNKIKTNTVGIVIFSLLGIVGNVFAVLCIKAAPVFFLRKHSALFSVLACCVICSFYVLGLWFTYSGKEALFKATLSAFIFLAFCLLLLFILIRTGFFAVIQNAESLRAYLAASGVWMPILYIVLQYLQVVILPIPSIVSTATGVALFGPFYTMVYSLLGISLGSVTAFLIGRVLGHKAVVWMVGEDTLTKWQEKLKGKDNLLLTIMFLLPLFPDDILCFIAGLSSMSFIYFVIMMFVARIIATAITSYSVDFFPLNTWWGILLWVLFFVVFAMVFMFIYKNMDRIQARLSKIFNRNKKR